MIKGFATFLAQYPIFYRSQRLYRRLRFTETFGFAEAKSFRDAFGVPVLKSFSNQNPIFQRKKPKHGKLWVLFSRGSVFFGNKGEFPTNPFWFLPTPAAPWWQKGFFAEAFCFAEIFGFSEVYAFPWFRVFRKTKFPKNPFRLFSPLLVLKNFSKQTPIFQRKKPKHGKLRVLFPVVLFLGNKREFPANPFWFLPTPAAPWRQKGFFYRSLRFCRSWRFPVVKNFSKQNSIFQRKKPQHGKLQVLFPRGLSPVVLFFWEQGRISQKPFSALLPARGGKKDFFAEAKGFAEVGACPCSKTFPNKPYFSEERAKAREITFLPWLLPSFHAKTLFSDHFARF